MTMIQRIYSYEYIVDLSDDTSVTMRAMNIKVLKSMVKDYAKNLLINKIAISHVFTTDGCFDSIEDYGNEVIYERE